MKLRSRRISRRKVGPSGPLDAEVVLVGRDPGEQEVERGMPFVGAAGKVLGRALRYAGLERSKLLVTNVVPWRPEGNEWERHREGDVEEGVRELVDLLKFAPRKLIVALGQQAFNAATGRHPDSGEYSITEARGYLFDGLGAKVLPCFHPSSCLYQWHPNFALLNWDLERAKRYVSLGRDGTGSNSRIHGWIGSRIEGEAFARELLQLRRVGADIETRADGTISCVGFASSPEKALTFPFSPSTAGFVREVMESERVEKWFHNGMFDVTMLERAGIQVRNWQDTMVAWHALEPALAGQRGKEGEKKGKKRTEKSLRFLASLLTWEPFWKDYDFQTQEDQYVLCAKDSRVTLEIANELERRLRE